MRSCGRGEIKRRWSRSLLDRWSVGRWTGVRSEECAVVVVGLELGLRTGLSLLPLSLSLSVFARESENGLN